MASQTRSGRRPSKKKKTLAASEFKAHCLRVLDDVAAGQEVVITKHGTEVALLTPIARRTGSSRGLWKGLVDVDADIVHADWSGDFEANAAE